MAATPSSPPPPGLAQDWEATWRAGVPPGTRWDIGGPWLPLVRLLRAGRVPPGHALVPGCGRGHDVLALAAPDRAVTGLEIAPTAAAEARALLAASGGAAAHGASIADGDFFTHSGVYSVIFDYTCLCATLPARRSEWASQMRALLLPGGLLICGAFPLRPWPPGAAEDPARGPPYQLSKQLYRDLLAPLGFVLELEEDVPAAESFPARVGYEALSLWRAPPR